jgi:hypothetical protein
MEAPTPTRRTQRMSAIIPVSLLLADHQHTTQFEAYTVDVSHIGMKLRTTFALYPGDTVGIALDEQSDSAISSRVVWVQRTAVGGSLAGLEFLDTLPV